MKKQGEGGKKDGRLSGPLHKEGHNLPIECLRDLKNKKNKKEGVISPSRGRKFSNPEGEGEKKGKVASKRGINPTSIKGTAKVPETVSLGGRKEILQGSIRTNTKRKKSRAAKRMENSLTSSNQNQPYPESLPRVSQKNRTESGKNRLPWLSFSQIVRPDMTLLLLQKSTI